MRPRAGTLAALTVAIALAGCGGGSNESASQPAAIPASVAQDLAGKSDAVADALDAGDTCKAAELADRLKDAVEAALAGGQVPPAFRGELERNATDLQNEVNCTEEEHGDEGKGKKKGQDTNSVTTTVGTTTSVGTTTGDGG